MRLAVCDYAHLPFGKVFDAMRDVETSLHRASDAAGILLQVEVGAVRVVAPSMVAVHACWRMPDGAPWFEGEVRILAVNRGADAVTELLLVGEAAREGDGGEQVLAAWAHRMLAGLSALAIGADLTVAGAAARG